MLAPMKNGFIYLHRKILYNPIFDNEKGLKVWLWCLLKANFKNKTTFLGLQKIKVKRGQFIFGRNVASEQLKMSPSTVRNWIAILKEGQYLDIKTTNKYSIITIINYDDYQNKDNRITTEKQQNNTTNKDNNDNKLPKGNNEYGNPEINQIIKSLQTQLGTPVLDESITVNRRYAHLLLKKSKQNLDGVLWLIGLINAKDRYCPRIGSTKDLYYKSNKIVQYAGAKKGDSNKRSGFVSMVG